MLNYKRNILSIAFSFFIFSFSLALTPDSSKYIIKSWKLNSFFDIEEILIDTNLNNFQIYNPLFRNSISNAFLGNFSSASISNIVISESFSENQITKSIEPFLFSYHNTEYYNTRKPYTNLFYTNGGQEQSLNVLHTRNINKRLNVGFKYNLISSIGFYKRQKTKKKSLSIFSSYISERYNIHINLCYNKFMFHENGGLLGLENTDFYIAPEFYSVNLNNANSIIKYSSSLVNQELKIGYNTFYKDSTTKDTVRVFSHFASIVHTLEYYKSYRIYEDFNPLSGFYKGVYTDSIDSSSSLSVGYIDFNMIPIYMDSIKTFDSIAHQLLSNSIFLKLNDDKFKVGFRLGLKHEISKYSIPNQDSLYLFDTIVYNSHFDSIYTNSSFSLGAYNNFNKSIKWFINTSFYFKGHKKSNIEIYGQVKKIFSSNKNYEKFNPFLALSANFSRKAPSFFEEHYFSNHYKWDSTFLAKDLTKIRLSYTKPIWNLSVGIAANIYDNFIYYNEIGQPSQTTSTYNVYSAYIIKNIKVGHFNVNNQLVYQDNGNKNVLRIPSMIYFNSTFFNFSLFKKAINLNLGVDIYYYNKYYGYSYIPATGVFNIQNNDFVGNYPLLDAFMNIKFKRARFFLKVTHVNYLLTSEKPLYTLSKYPINGRTLKMGISWNFYD
jgi:hypothetical protein